MLRGERLALLLTTFPVTHWLTLCLAGSSIVVAFLVESDDQSLLFLDRLQLRACHAPPPKLPTPLPLITRARHASPSPRGPIALSLCCPPQG